MSLPPEFFTPEELADTLETPQPARQCEILSKQGVPFVRSASGKPRVYRDALRPAHSAPNVETFDFSAIASGKAKETVEH